MLDIDWNQFKVKNKNVNSAFETMCYHLFCREHGITKGINADHNQVGIESHTVEVSGVNHGFQAKFFSNNIDYDDLKGSIDKAIEQNYGRLDNIIIYINKPIGSQAKIPTAMLEHAFDCGITLELIDPSSFEILLNQPKNLDITKLFFGLGDEFNFLRNSSDPEKNNLLLSKEFVQLPIHYNSGDPTSLADWIKNEDKKTFCIFGNPGSGKSVILHQLFNELVGLNLNDIEEINSRLVDLGAIPTIINLKSCLAESLENLLSNRRADCSLKGLDLDYIYLFDGLDEVPEHQCDSLLHYIKELSKVPSTKKIVFTCRSGNKNRFVLNAYFNDLLKCEIGELSADNIKSYFDRMGSSDKTDKYKFLTTSNPALVEGVTDVIILKILWETIDAVDNTTTPTDLFGKKINLMLRSPKHAKFLSNLNLPDPKEERVLDIARNTAAFLHSKYQHRILITELQGIVHGLFSKIDYKSVNEIINYVADLFFDHTSTNQDDTSYIFRHRRYQEYLFAKTLIDLYLIDAKELRKSGVLTQRDFVDNIFFPSLRKHYVENADLVGFLEVALIDTYLGKYRGFGADDAYYLESSFFIPALSTQEESAFDEIMNDMQLQIKRNILVDLTALEEKVREWQRDSRNYRSENYVGTVWESGVRSLITAIRVLWENGKEDLAKEASANLDKTIALFIESGFLDKDSDSRRMRDPAWEVYPDWLFYRLIMHGDPIEQVFNDRVKGHRSKEEDIDMVLPGDLSKNEKLYASFFEVTLVHHKTYLFDKVSQFDEFEMSIFLYNLVKPIHISKIFSNDDLKATIVNFLQTVDTSKLRLSSHIFYLKTLLGLGLSVEETEKAEERFDELRDQRQIDWHLKSSGFEYGQICFALNKFNFDKQSEERLKFGFDYFLPNIALACLFKGYSDVLAGGDNPRRVIVQFQNYITSSTRDMGNYLQKEIAEILGLIIAECNQSEAQLSISSIINLDFISSRRMSFFKSFWDVNKAGFESAINVSDLAPLEIELGDWDREYQEFVDNCLLLSMFFSSKDSNRSRAYLTRAINEGTLRHGWRKDPIVAQHLTNALEILWAGNYWDRDILSQKSRQVFELTKAVVDITDGKGTWRGPYNLIDVLVDYDLNLAIQFKDDLKEWNPSYPNSLVTTILKARIRRGDGYPKIKEGLKEFRLEYDHKGQVRADYFEEKFKVFVFAATADVYSKEVKEEAFKDAFELVDKVLEKKIEYAFHRGGELESEKEIYKELCSKYSSDFKLLLSEKDGLPEKIPTKSEKQFVSDFLACDNQSDIEEAFDELKNYDNNILIVNHDSWNAIVNHTYSVCSNGEPFFKYLSYVYYPHTDWHSKQSDYLQYGLATALANPELRNEALSHILNEAGHGGFLNVMRCLVVNADKDGIRKLFDRFLNMCELLVYKDY